MGLYDKIQELQPYNDDYDDSWSQGFEAGRDAAAKILLEEMVLMEPAAWIFHMPTGRGLSFYDPNLTTAVDKDRLRPAVPLFSRNQLLGGKS